MRTLARLYVNMEWVRLFHVGGGITHTGTACNLAGGHLAQKIDTLQVAGLVSLKNTLLGILHNVFMYSPTLVVYWLTEL